MAASPQFPHLRLLFKADGRAVLEGGGKPSAEEVYNKENRSHHRDYLKRKIAEFTKRAAELKLKRKNLDLPEIRGGVPFVLKIPNNDERCLEFIAQKLGLEIVAEYDDGFLIVSSTDLHLSNILHLADAFADSTQGSAQMAKILEIDDDPLSTTRLNRILGDLIEKWPFTDAEMMILDVSIEVIALGIPPKLKKITVKSSSEWIARRTQEYEAARDKYWQELDERRIEREEDLQRIVDHYDGKIHSIADNSNVVEFPDSFSARIEMSGRGFKDLISTFPNLFEISSPDEFDNIDGASSARGEEGNPFELLEPEETSPTICVIDSGIQEEHRWLSSSIVTALSKCFIPGKTQRDVADEVPGGGHGTRVAGAILYPSNVPLTGTYQSPFWIINARVLDEHNNLIARIFPADLLKEISTHFHGIAKTRIFQHSIASNTAHKTSRMSVWAATIDLLSYKYDFLFIQAAGNLRDRGAIAVRPGILDHIVSGRTYPSYLLQPSSRIANPAQSLQALTVGSISSDFYQTEDLQSVSDSFQPSSFSRSGWGLWNSIKPEVVEFGGEKIIEKVNPTTLRAPTQVCPELVRSTARGGPPFAKDAVGTSFSTPKITHIAGHLAALFPEQSTLLYRALIVNSARWPEWAQNASAEKRPAITRCIGYGVPDLERATENTENRVTLITESSYHILARQGLIFGIPIPESLRRPGDDYSVRVDITLSYSAMPRRTRKSRRGYLAVWLDWKSSKKNETFETFKGRALHDEDNGDGTNDGNFPWFFGNKKEKDGLTDGVSRKNGTVQKDWMIARSYELPDIFGVVVRGHEGWDRFNPDASARFTLAVSFESLGNEIKIYETIENAIDIEARTEQRVTD